ncbi:MAG: hypothetical protein AB1489_06385 [Acidobacteriota bacterium]
MDKEKHTDRFTMLEKRDGTIDRQISLLSGLAEEAGRQGVRRVGLSLNLNLEAEESKVELIARSEIISRFSFKDVMATGIFTQVLGVLPGTSFVLIPRDNALRIIAGATGAKPDRPVSLSAFTPQLVLKRIGENFSLTYFEGIAIMLQRAVRPRLTAPEVIFDAWDTTLNQMTQRLSTNSNNLYIFWLRFCCIIGNERCQGVHLYLVDQELLDGSG